MILLHPITINMQTGCPIPNELSQNQRRQNAPGPEAPGADRCWHTEPKRPTAPALMMNSKHGKGDTEWRWLALRDCQSATGWLLLLPLAPVWLLLPLGLWLACKLADLE